MATEEIKPESLFHPMKVLLDENDLPGLIKFLDNNNNNVDARDEDEVTLLMVAAVNGLTDFCEELLSRGANINAMDSNHMSPLIHASYNGRMHLIKGFIDKGAEVEHRDKAGLDALDYCISLGYPDGKDMLLEEIIKNPIYGKFPGQP